MNGMKSGMLLTALTCLAMVACGVAPNEQARVDQGLVPVLDKADDIDPGDNIGKILVKLPEGVESSHWDFWVGYRDDEVEPGTTYYATPGDGCIAIYYGGSDTHHRYAKECGIEVKRGQTTEYTLAVAGLDWDPEQYQVDIGPRAKVILAWNSMWLGEFELDGAAPTAGIVMLPVAGYTLGMQPAIVNDYFSAVRQFDLTPGQHKDIALTPNRELRAEVVVEPADKKYENPHLGECKRPDNTVWPVGNLHFLFDRNRAFSPDLKEPLAFNPYFNKDHYIDTFVFANGQDELKARMFPRTDSESPNHYEYAINNLKMELPVQSGETMTIPVERIDVGHVNTVYNQAEELEIPGTYRVKFADSEFGMERIMTVIKGTYLDCSGAWTSVPDRYATQTGMYVLPGTFYRITIDYEFPDGNKRQQTWACDYRQPFQGESRCTLEQDADN
jgi:hypothetical protein